MRDLLHAKYMHYIRQYSSCTYESAKCRQYTSYCTHVWSIQGVKEDVQVLERQPKVIQCLLLWNAIYCHKRRVSGVAVLRFSFFQSFASVSSAT